MLRSRILQGLVLGLALVPALMLVWSSPGIVRAQAEPRPDIVGAQAEPRPVVVEAQAEQRPAPIRVASINLCTDQLVLALAQDRQIVGLGKYAHHAGISFLWRKAERFVALRGHAEELLPLRPDLVLAGRYTGRETRRVLKRAGLDVREFAPPRDLAGLFGQIHEVGALLGVPGRARQLVEQIRAAGRDSRSLQPGLAEPWLAAMWNRGGRVSGRDELLDVLVRQAGFATLGERTGRKRGFTLSLEDLVLTEPDAIISEPVTDHTAGPATAALAHPVLGRLFHAGGTIGARPVFRPARALTICGGPATVAAIQAFQAFGAALDRTHTP